MMRKALKGRRIKLNDLHRRKIKQDASEKNH